MELRSEPVNKGSVEAYKCRHVMIEPVYRIDKRQNKKMLWWFLIALVIAILPWFLLAEDQFGEKGVVNTENSEKPAATRHCDKVSTTFTL
jgi:ABC-type uncharacterized transport system permease subunit